VWEHGCAADAVAARRRAWGMAELLAELGAADPPGSAADSD
jgi:hypothetical protein